MMPLSKTFEELSFYTLSHPDSNFFIHQLVVDAYTAQTATKDTKGISLVFALVGLYLFNEKKYTGKQVQRAHMVLAKFKQYLPEIKLPIERGNINIVDVLMLESNEDRDQMIKKWSASVWEAFNVNRAQVKKYCDDYLTT